MDASTPTTSVRSGGRSRPAAGAGPLTGGAQARHPRIHAAMPWVATSPAPSPARARPPATTSVRKIS